MVNFFGCQHENITWPQGKLPHVHVCCLDCGKEMRYDWQNMRILPDKKPVRFQQIQFIADRSSK